MGAGASKSSSGAIPTASSAQSGFPPGSAATPRPAPSAASPLIRPPGRSYQPITQLKLGRLRPHRAQRRLGDTRAAVLVRSRSDRVFMLTLPPPSLARWAVPAVTATRSPAPMRTADPAPMLSWPLTTLSRAGCVCGLGAGCVPSWPGETAWCEHDAAPIVRGSGSGLRSSACPNLPAGL